MKAAKDAVAEIMSKMVDDKSDIANKFSNGGQ